MLKGEIIAVGTELLLGQIANTNAQYISKKMAEIGVPIYYHVTVGDNENRLEEVIKQAKARSNLIIFTGGLGPTQDDITKEVVAKVLNKKMVLDESTFANIISYFTKRQVEMTDNNRKQAMIIEGSTVFTNEFGLSAGIGLKEDGILYVFLPGPPSELKPMVNKYLLPWIMNVYQGQTFYSTVLRFIGIGEAALESKIIDIIENQTNPSIAPLASDSEVTIRLTASAKNEETAKSLIAPVEKAILKRLKEYHFGYGDESIENTVLNLLKQQHLTLSLAESCTGGLISSKLTAIPGSSSVYRGGIVCYQNEVKQNVLNISAETLASYGAVSNEAANQLANNTLQMFNTDIALAITGIAGPDIIEDKPVGLIYIGISDKGKNTEVKEIRLSGSRQFIQERAVKFAYYFLWDFLKERLIYK